MDIFGYFCRQVKMGRLESVENQLEMSIFRLLAIMAFYVVFCKSSLPFSIFWATFLFCLQVHLEDKVIKKSEVQCGKKGKPDSFEWVNKLILSIWLHNRITAQELFRQFVWPLIHEEIRDEIIGCNRIKIAQFYIGDESVKILNISAWTEGNDLILDAELTYHGNAFFKFEAEILRKKIPVIIQNIKIEKGKIRIVLKNANSREFLSGIHFAFVEPPKCDWDINNLGGIADIPGFDELILHIINVRLTNRVILPR